MNIKKSCSELIQVLDYEGDNALAVRMKQYMKNKFEFYGVPSPLRKQISKASSLWSYKFSAAELKEMMGYLWNIPQREAQYVAVDIAIRNNKVLTTKDIPWIASLILDKSWWDTVDAIASNLIGPILAKSPENIPQYNKEWIHTDNVWLIRTAIIFQLKFKEKTDIDLLMDNILLHKTSREFFINKASGWALRQYAKLYPDVIRQFVESHPELPKLTIREALKHLLPK